MEVNARIVGQINSTFGTVQITWNSLGTAIRQSLGLGTTDGVMNFRKLRITSMVIESATEANNSTDAQQVLKVPDFIGDTSGNHWAPADINKPLRIRFSNVQGSDGEWKKSVSIGTTMVVTDGYGAAQTNIGALQFSNPSPVDVSVSIRFRVAFTDGFQQIPT